MRVRIHRGAAEIGGNCIEVEEQGARVLLDLGRPLEAARAQVVPLPSVEGLHGGGAVLGVVVSHPHQDHWGLVPQLPAGVPVYLGARAHRVLQASAFFSPAGATFPVAGYLSDGEPLQLGPFRITPWLVDHSAFDAYALLVDAGGKRLFYSGDLRAHGRKGALFERLLERPPVGVDALLLEGTLVAKEGQASRAKSTEDDVELAAAATMRQTPGLVLAAFSPQNVDRLVTLHRAAKRAGRLFVMDLYAAMVASATGVPSIPKASWDDVRVYVPESVRRRVKREGRFELTEGVRPRRIYRESLARSPGRFVLTFRGAMARELEQSDCLAGARVVWSLWSGYLERDAAMQAFVERQQLQVVHHHASGHAFVGDLQRLVRAMRPKRVVPIHSVAPERYGSLFPDVERHADGEWWGV